jgi:hypothetical protein
MEVERTEEIKTPWPKFNWVLPALQLLLGAAVLVCLGWYGLNDSYRIGLPSTFFWLPGIAVCCPAQFGEFGEFGEIHILIDTNL